MAHALRRVLWLVPALLGVSMVTFWMLAELGVRPDGGTDALPLFFNRAPRDVRDRALGAVAEVARSDSAAGRAELARLGGAALPHVLPMLDTLAPEARIRVAVALAPIARRMGMGTEAQLTLPEQAVLFWSDFWQSRSVDFREPVVKRLVQRLGQRSSRLRREDVVQLDTFALEELIGSMSPVRTDEDVQRVRRLSRLASQLTGRDWRITTTASTEEAKRVASRWQRWWISHRSSYVTFHGPRRISAMLTETRYGRWAAEALQSRLGLTRDGEPVWDALLGRARVTGWLLLVGLLGGSAAALLLGTVGGSGAGIGARVATGLALLLAALPVAARLPEQPASGGSTNTTLYAALVMIASTAGWLALLQRRAAREALDRGELRTALAQGSSPRRFLWRDLRALATVTLSACGALAPEILTSAFVVEHGLGLSGLGPATLEAVRAGDGAWLMALSLLCALTVALLQIASDLLLELVHPAFRAELGPARGRA